MGAAAVFETAAETPPIMKSVKKPDIDLAGLESPAIFNLNAVSCLPANGTYQREEVRWKGEDGPSRNS